MKRILCLVLLLAVAFNAGAQQKAAKKKKKKNSSSTERMAGPILTIHFFSKGAGIDNAAYEKVEAFANNHLKKPSYAVIQQGREGEKKMTFALTELTPDEQTGFVNELNALVGSNDRVKIDTKIPYKKNSVTPESISPIGQLGQAQKTQTRLVISFISKGGGIEGKDAEKIKTYIENHPKKPAFEVKTWGREGEKDYLLSLKELTPDEQKVFVEEVKKLVSSPEMVFIKENEVYVKKGR